MTFKQNQLKTKISDLKAEITKQKKEVIQNSNLILTYKNNIEMNELLNSKLTASKDR